MYNFFSKKARQKHRAQKKAQKERDKRAGQIRKLLQGVDFKPMSFQPEREQKPSDVIRSEIEYLWVNGKGAWTAEDTFTQYFSTGMDLKGVDIHGYIMQYEQDMARNKLNPKFAHMLDDKEITLRYLTSQGIPASSALGYVDQQGRIHCDNDTTIEDFSEWLAKYGQTVFIKDLAACQGVGCCRASASKTCGEIMTYINEHPVSREEFKKHTKRHAVEVLLTQTESMSKVYPGAINTVRIVTLSGRKGIVVFMSHLTFGANGSPCSNQAQGGIVVGVNEEGILTTDGHMKHPPLVSKHPNSGIIFKGYVIPEYKACVELAKRAHRTLSRIYSIGWDIAITPNGPVIIEANRDWGTVAYPALYGPNKEKFLLYFHGGMPKVQETK